VVPRRGHQGRQPSHECHRRQLEARRPVDERPLEPHLESLIGSSAFVVAGALCAGAYLFGFCPELSVGSRLLAAGLASLVGAVAELFSGPRLDDNLAIPIASTLVAAIFV
jgi:hypothetical protein